MNPVKRGSLDRSSSSGSQKGSESRPSPAMHERSSGKHSPASSHSPASKCGSIPLLQNEMSRAAAGFLANFPGATGFTPPMWQELQYLMNPLATSFMPPLPLGLDMFPSPFLHPITGSAPGLFPPGLPLLRPPGGASGLIHSPYAALFPNVNDVPPVHLMPKQDQPGSRPRSAKKTSSLTSSSSESDIPGRSGATNLSGKHDPLPSHSNKQFWHSAAEMAKPEARKLLSGSPIVSAKSKHEEVVDVLNCSDCDHESPLELTVKKSNKSSVPEAETKKLCLSKEDIVVYDDVNSRGNSEVTRVIPSEKFSMQSVSDDVVPLSLGKSSVSSLKHAESIPSLCDRVANDNIQEEAKDKIDDQRSFLEPVASEKSDKVQNLSATGCDFGPPQVPTLSQAQRQNIALPPRKRLTRNPEDLGLSVPSQSSGSDSPSSTSNFRSCWKKFAAKANHNGQSRAFASGGKPLYDCRTFFQKMAAKDACKSGILIGKTFIAGKGKGYFHRTVSRTSPRFTRNEGGAGLPPDGSTSPRVTRSQSKLKQKKSASSPKSSPSEPPAPVRKSMRKKTANSKYDIDDVIKTGCKGSAKKDTPSKTGAKPSAKTPDKEPGKTTKAVDPSEFVEDGDPKKSAKPYSLRDREEKCKGRGTKPGVKDGNQKSGESSTSLSTSNSSQSESFIETPEKKKEGADDSFDEKAFGSGLRNVEHDGKSISSGISTCSVDMDLDVNMKLPPKFRRTKRQALSTSQSVSSVEDDRSTEGVKDVKIDLCRSLLEGDQSSSQASCCRTQSPHDVSIRVSESLIEEDSQAKFRFVEAQSEISKITSEGVSVAGKSDFVHEDKPVQKSSCLDFEQEDVKSQLGKRLEPEKTADVGERLSTTGKCETDKRLDAENEAETVKQTVIKTDKPTGRSTGGKKNFLYRSALNAALDESATVSKSEANVSDGSICVEGNAIVSEKTSDARHTSEHDNVSASFSASVVCSSDDKPVISNVDDDDDNTICDHNQKRLHEGNDIGDGVKPAPEQRVKSVLDFTGIWSPALGSSQPHISLPQADPKLVSKDTTDFISRSSDSNSDALNRQTSVTKDVLVTGSNSESVDSAGHGLTHSKFQVSSLTSGLSASHSADSDQVEAASKAKDPSQVQPPDLILQPTKPVQAKAGDETSAETSVDQKEKNRDGAADVDVKAPKEEPIRVKSVPKKRATDDVSGTRRKKQKMETISVADPVKAVTDKASRGSKQPSGDIRTAQFSEEDATVSSAGVSAKNSTINPLRFYNKTSTLHLSLASSAVASCQDASRPVAEESLGSKKAVFAPHQSDDNSRQSSVSELKEQPDLSADPIPNLDSEPPILEKTDFTYMEQFSDISDTEEGEGKGPPMLEATSNCNLASSKPCASIALDKHILFAKIATSSRQESVGPHSDDPPTAFKASSTINERQSSNTHSAGYSNDSVSVGCLETSDSYSPTPCSSSWSSTSKSVVQPSVVSRVSVSSVVDKVLEPAPTSGLPDPVSRRKGSSKKKSHNKSGVSLERASSEACRDDYASSSGSVSRCPEGDSYSCTTLSTGDLESCGIGTKSAPGIDARQDGCKSASRLVLSTKHENNLDALLQHCKSLSVVVQKIDGSQKSNHPAGYELESAAANATSVDRETKIESAEQMNLRSAVEEKGKKTRVIRKRAKAEQKDVQVSDKRTVKLVVEKADVTHKGESAETMHATENSESAPKKILPERGSSRIKLIRKAETKLKSNETKNEREETEKRHSDFVVDVERENDPRTLISTSESQNARAANETTGHKRQSRGGKDPAAKEIAREKPKWNEANVAKTDDKDLSSVYDFDKDPGSLDTDVTLGSGKAFRKTATKEKQQAMQPLRLKLLVPEHSRLMEAVPPAPEPVAKCNIVDKNIDSVSKSSKQRKRKVGAVISLNENENSSSSEKLSSVASADAASNPATIGHVKCRLVKVGRHQWISVGEANAQESQQRNTPSHEEPDLDDTPSRTKRSREPRKTCERQSHDRSNSRSSKRSKTNSRNNEPSKKKREKRGSLTNFRDNVSQSDNSVRSQYQDFEVSSPQSSFDQASHCSENDHAAVIAGEESSSAAANYRWRMPDFLDALLGDDVEGLVLDETNEVKTVDASLYTNLVLEHASFGNISSSEDFCETLSPTSTFFMPSEIELQMAKMTLSERSRENEAAFGTSDLLKTKMDDLQTNSDAEMPPVHLPDGVVPQVVEWSSTEVDHLLTQTLPNHGDGDDDLTSGYGVGVMEDFVSWLSPKWDEASLHDFEDPWGSANLLSPFADFSTSWQKLNT